MSARAVQFSKNLERFRLITFDITDTLLRFSQEPSKQYAKTAMEHGIECIDQHQMKQCFRKEFKYMAKMYPNFGCAELHMAWQDWWIKLVERVFRCQNEQFPDAKLRAIAEKLLHIYRTNEVWRHTEGSKELLKRLRTTGKKIGVISNFDPSLPKVLQAMQINKYFDFILTSYDARVQKPDERIFQQALDKCQVKAEEALHIGNLYEIDFIGARNAGWCSLLLQKKGEEKKSDCVKYSFANLKELLEKLETCDIQW